jgi:hypothetical protein
MTKWHPERKPMASGSPGRPPPAQSWTVRAETGGNTFGPFGAFSHRKGPAMLSAWSPLADPDARSYDDLARSQLFGT